MSSMDFVKLGEQEGGHRDRIIRTLLKFQIVTGDFVFVTFETFDEESQICADGMRTTETTHQVTLARVFVV